MATPASSLSRPAPPSREEREDVEWLLVREWAVWVWVARVIGEDPNAACSSPTASTSSSTTPSSSSSSPSSAASLLPAWESCGGLCGLLKNGERLTRLMEVLRQGMPAAIRSSSPTSCPSSPETLPPVLQQRARLRRFLHACATDFGLPSSSRFTVDELYYHAHLPNLLDCLESLERRAVEDGFAKRIPDQEQVLLQQLERWGCKQRIPCLGATHRLRAAKALAKWPHVRSARQRSPYGTTIRHAPKYVILPETGVEETPSVATIAPSPQLDAAAIKIQSTFRMWRARRNYKVKARNARMREHVAKEIYDTEKEYAQNLQILVQVYLKKMQNWTEEVSVISSFKALYGDIKVIYGYTEQVLEQLRPRVYAWGPHQVVGDIFLQLSFFLKVYTQYVAHYSKAIRELAESKRSSPRFAQFIDAPWSMDPSVLLFRDKLGSLGIQSFLIQPVQRVPRYLLLLKALLKKTEPDHRDFNNIQKAVHQVAQVAEFIEKRARDSENIARAIDIQYRLQPKLQIVQPNRKFVRSGSMVVEICQAAAATSELSSTKRSYSSRRRQGAYEVLLFSDLLLITKPKGDSNLPDSRLKLVASYDINQLHPIADLNEHLRFGMVSQSGQMIVRFTATSASERHSWLQDLAKLKIMREMSRKQRAEILRRARDSGTVLFLSSSSRSVSTLNKPRADGTTSNSLSSACFINVTEASSIASSAEGSTCGAPNPIIVEEGEWKSSYDSILAAVLANVYSEECLDNISPRASVAATAAEAAARIATQQNETKEGRPRSRTEPGEAPRHVLPGMVTLRPALVRMLRGRDELKEATSSGSQDRRHATWNTNDEKNIIKKKHTKSLKRLHSKLTSWKGDDARSKAKQLQRDQLAADGAEAQVGKWNRDCYLGSSVHLHHNHVQNLSSEELVNS